MRFFGLTAALSAALASACDGGSPSDCDPFADRIVSFDAGTNAGTGQDRVPGVVLGAPVGGGAAAGGTDVLSLGEGGVIVLAFDGPGIPDGPGADLLVFENAFYVGGDPSQPYAELAAVAVSEDGTDFAEYPCNPSSAWPHDGCAGWHAVLSAPGNGIDPTDPETAGGDAFDLADLGLTHARFVRIRDLSPGGDAPPGAGFDLDGAAAVHACE